MKAKLPPPPAPPSNIDLTLKAKSLSEIEEIRQIHPFLYKKKRIRKLNLSADMLAKTAIAVIFVANKIILHFYSILSCA